MPYWMKSLFLIPLMLVSPLQAEPLQKTFASWQLTCNNLNFCMVRNIPGDQGLVMTLSRQAGINDRPQLRIDYGNAYSGALKGEALADNLLIDARRLKMDLKHWQVEPHHLVTTHEISLEEFLGQILPAHTIQMTWRPQAAIALNGLQDALAQMDQVQGRSGGLSAWVKRGPREAWAITPPPRAPEVWQVHNAAPPLTRDETSGLIDFGTWRVNTESCSLDPLRREVTVAPLTTEKALLLVSCEMGAYNTISLAFEVSRSQPYVARGLALRLPFTPPGGERSVELLNAQYDPSNSQLSLLAKGRGLGDCGSRSRWQFDGKSFVLAEYAEESECDNWHGSDNWPNLWQTRAVVD
ncbi:hypothetical protein CIG19_14350 [Enterobacterales bacterium CwR94]|nr:hypothetical protein CIG19_14350 [Enterobacterales bacterium CwR94]